MKYADAPLDADGTTPLTGDALFASRGAHLLYFEDADRAAEWKKALPELAWSSDGPTTTLHVSSLGWLLSFVGLAEDAEEEPFAYRQPSPAAWARWLAALIRAAVPMHRKQLGVWLTVARATLRTAAEDVRDALVLHQADLEDGQGARPTLAAAGAISPSPQEVLHSLTWGELAHRRERSLELAGELLYYGGSLRRQLSIKTPF